MNIEHLQEQVNQLVETMLEEKAKLVPASQLQLDERCGSLYVADDFIAAKRDNNRRLRYYGGFEYVDEENITYIGDYVIYNNNCDRVYEAIEYFQQTQEETE